MNKPNFVMMVGLPYSGKSFIVDNLLKDYVRISTDKIVQEYAESQGKTYNEVFKECIDKAQKIANLDLAMALKEQKNIVIDQTNLTITSRARKMSQVHRVYKKIAIFVPTPDIGELEERIKSRKSHTVPMEVLKNMQNIMQEPTVSEGFDVVYKAGFDDIILTKE